ncbi:MAG: hypothetical protein VX776_12075 [Planctomycetota bacterium]|nr:hypothetical protein [Planctomycetota bacterium]
MVLRNLASISLIASYLTMFVGGGVLHQLQHMVAGDICVTHSDRNASSSSDEAESSCSHSHADHLTDFVLGNEELLGTSLPRKQNHDDESTDCWTCYVLSQAGDTPYAITLPADIDSVYSISTALEDWQLQVNPHSFLVRGPPEFLLQRS